MLDIVTVAVEPKSAIAQDNDCPDPLNLTVLKGVFSSGDNSYQFEIGSDGAGKIFYSDFPTDADEFAHEVNVETLHQKIEEAIKAEIALQSQQNALEESEIESIREEIFREMLEEVFWEEINQTLEDPFSARFTTTVNGARSFKRSAARLMNLSNFWNCQS